MGQGQLGGLLKQGFGGDCIKGDGGKKEKKYEFVVLLLCVGCKQWKQKGFEVVVWLFVVIFVIKCKL